MANIQGDLVCVTVPAQCLTHSHKALAKGQKLIHQTWQLCPQLPQNLQPPSHQSSRIRLLGLEGSGFESQLSLCD